jgi:hypothetical protein
VSGAFTIKGLYLNLWREKSFSLHTPDEVLRGGRQGVDSLLVICDAFKITKVSSLYPQEDQSNCEIND